MMMMSWGWRLVGCWGGMLTHPTPQPPWSPLHVSPSCICSGFDPSLVTVPTVGAGQLRPIGITPSVGTASTLGNIFILLNLVVDWVFG